MSVTVSGWCSPAPGMTHTRREHVACRSRVCDCEAFGGHERPAVDRDSRRGMVGIERMIGENRDEPDRGVSAPQPGSDRLTLTKKGGGW